MVVSHIPVSHDHEKHKNHKLSPNNTDQDRKNALKASDIWKQSKNASGTLVENYLRSRALTITPPEALRFHPSVEYWVKTEKTNWQLIGKFPCMIALVQHMDNNKNAVIHRTYLNHDGSGKLVIKPVQAIQFPAKKILGNCSGGAVRFHGEDLRCIALSEGIENGLTYWQENPGMTVWSCLSASGLASIVLPPPLI